MVVTDPNVELWFEDEAHIGRNTTVTRMWAPCGEQPKLLSAATRQKVGILGVVNPASGELFGNFAHPFNGETFKGFVKSFLDKKADNNKKVVMILDNASWHKKATREIECEYAGKFEALYLPPYSPDLNPIERVWRLLRRKCTHNKYFDSIVTLQNVLQEFLAQYAKPNEILRTLCAVF